MIGIMPTPSTNPGLPPGRVRRLRAGEALFRAGDPALGLVTVRAGTVELRRAGADGRTALMDRVGPAEALAEASLFEARHHCDAVAATEAVVEVVSRRAFDAAARDDPDLIWRLAAHLARRLVEARARAERLALPGAAERVLSSLAARRPGADGVRALGGPWRSLAGECGLTPEATYRALARLEREGAIRRVATGSGDPGVILVRLA